MKTLIDFIDSDTRQGWNNLPLIYVHEAVSNALASGVVHINMTRDEYAKFCTVYSNILPHDWDRKSFRGLIITIVANKTDKGV